MPVLALLIAESLTSGAVLFGLKRSQKRADIEASLMDWEVEQTTPIVDNLADHWSGHSESAPVEFTASSVVKCIRDVVNRKAFRLCVEGIVRPNSKIREFIERMQNANID